MANRWVSQILLMFPPGLAGLAYAETIVGRVVGVTDGDTVTSSQPTDKIAVLWSKNRKVFHF